MRQLKFSLLTLIPFSGLSIADFHITKMSGKFSGTHWVACPSDYYNCKCLAAYDRAGRLVDGTIGDNTFNMQAGMCGMPLLNFYKAGNTYNFYIAGGDGTIQGTCYYNDNFQNPPHCFGEGGFEDWICYSGMCNPSSMDNDDKDTAAPLVVQ